ncbi:retinol dehydrogenase 11-like [Diadema antillarum]|uniref:retinol dehydrogenase 11-like n=1 Tax=Diadema antillarum TaxID=105358 RepID=UPI003A871C24
MEFVRAVFVFCKDLLQQEAEWFQAASLPVKIAVSGAGVLAATYGVWYAWFFGGTRRVKSSVRLDGKTVIITGANAGIGRETAVDLASRGARVIMACRNPTKAQAALAEVRQRSGSDNVVFKQVDTSDLKSVRAFADQILKEEDRLDILINNAGVVAAKEILTPEGFDMIMSTNHVGHFVLTMTLMDLLKKSAPSRILNVSSLSHAWYTDKPGMEFSNKSGKGLEGLQFYARSKLANVIFAKELARRLAGTGVTAYSLHPGAIFSSLWRTDEVWLHYFMRPLFWLCLLNEKDGAQTTVYCAIDDSVTQHNGEYFANCQLAKESMHEKANDVALTKQLWDVSCEAAGIDPNVPLVR